MSFRGAKGLRLVALVVGVLALVGIAAAAMPLMTDWWQKSRVGADYSSAGQSESSAKLVPNRTDALILPQERAYKLGIQTEAVKEAIERRPLELSGSLVLDTNHLVRMHAHFPGEVVSIENAKGLDRQIRYGDRVTKGQLLAVVWNTDLGNKKGDLVDALSALRVDERTYEVLKKLEAEGAVSHYQVEQGRRAVEADLNRVAAAERTLRTWRVPEKEIDDVKEEARRIVERQGKRDPAKEKAWPRVEVIAPFDGIVVEKNVALGDFVDTSTNLFQIANLDKLMVWAHAREEDLPALEALTPQQRRWKVHLHAEPKAEPLQGTIDVIGFTIDPNQHTAVVMGLVDNPKGLHSVEGRLRSGQFVTATVDLPAFANEVVIPTAALVEDGDQSIVFVQLDRETYEQRRVAVARRTQDKVYLRALLSREEVDKKKLQTLRPGDRVVTEGNVELQAVLEALQTEAKVQEPVVSRQ